MSLRRGCLLQSSIVKSFLQIILYIYRKDRSTHGGGVLIALDESMPSSMIPTLSNLEVITVRIDVGQITTVCTVYVPPCACYNYQVSLLTYLNNIVSTSDCVLIVSDFNLLNISWSSLTGTSPFSNSLCELIFD